MLYNCKVDLIRVYQYCRYLMWALDEGNHGFQRQDMRRIISGIATRPSGSHIAWGFFKAEWDVFFERYFCFCVKL